MERGQAPSDEIEDEWLNSLKKEFVRVQALREKKKVLSIFTLTDYP